MRQLAVFQHPSFFRLASLASSFNASRSAFKAGQPWSKLVLSFSSRKRLRSATTLFCSLAISAFFQRVALGGVVSSTPPTAGGRRSSCPSHPERGFALGNDILLQLRHLSLQHIALGLQGCPSNPVRRPLSAASKKCCWQKLAALSHHWRRRRRCIPLCPPSVPLPTHHREWTMIERSGPTLLLHPRQVERPWWNA